jgi:uncharacterized damage-inducible protein DinB
MDLNSIQQLYAYNSWANQRTIAGCETLTTDQFLEPLGGSFGSVRNTLAHIMDVEWLYIERWYGRSPSAFPKPENYPDLSHIKERWNTIDSDMDQFLRELSPERLTKVIEFRNIKGILSRHPLWHVMQHVVNHGTYHRGQITTLLRQLGATPQASDLIFFYRERSGQPTP